MVYPEASGRPPLRLHLGQILFATTRFGPEGLILDLGRHRLPARTALEVDEGDRLRLQVMETTPRLALRLLSHHGPRPAVEAALRAALPRQGSAARWVRAVREARSHDQEHGVPLINDILDVLPRRPTLERPEGVREAIQNSGLFLERRLSGAGTGSAEALDQDLKAALLRHARRVEAVEPPSEFLRCLGEETRRLLARLEVLQCRAVLTDAPMDWSFEWPVRDGDELTAVQLRIRSEDEREASGRRYTVDLGLVFTHAGPVHARVRVHGGGVGIAWWAEHYATASALAQALPELRDRLEEAGHPVEALSCVHAPSAPTASSEGPAPEGPPRGLLSERV